MNLNNRTDIVTLAVVLALVGAAAAVLLGWVADLTRKPIEEAAGRRNNAALAEVLPAAYANAPSERPLTIGPVTYYGALDAAGDLIGVAGQYASPKGYAGKVEVLVGLTPEGAVRTVSEGRSGVLVTAHQETPGLGSVIADRKQQKTLTTLFDRVEGLPGNPILDQFAGRGTGSEKWLVSKDGGDFAYKTGATVTSRAVTEAVGFVVETFRDNRAAIMDFMCKEGK